MSSVWDSNVLDNARRMRVETNFTWDQVAEVINTQYDLDTNGNALRKAIARREETFTLLDSLPEPTPKRFPEVLHIPFDNVLLIGDLHIDYYDRTFLREALTKAEQCKCKGIILGGDTFNGGEVSSHAKNEPYVTPLKDEMDMAGKVLSVLGNLPFVEWIAICNGNHDERYSKKLNAYATLESLVYGALAGASIKAKLYISDRDYLYYGDDWGIGHLSSWCKEGGKLALEQARKHNKRVFAVWHDHIQGVQCDENHMGVSVGSMLCEDSQYYKERRLSRFNAFVNGYMINHFGRPLLFNKRGIHPVCGV